MFKQVAKFKETAVGTIPEEWDVVKLGDVVEKIVDNRGKTPPIIQNGYELLEVNSIKSGHRSPDYSEVEKFINEETYRSWFRTGHILKNDLIIPTVGTIGNLAISLENRGSIAQNLIALRINKKNNPAFIYYILSSPNYKEKLLNLDIGGVQPSIKVPHLINLEIPIPETLEQKQIAEILSSLDDKIELNRKINTNLEKLASVLFKKWFVDIGDELPKGWRMGTFGEAVTNFDSKRIPLSSREREKKQGSCPYYGATSIMDYVNDYIFDGTYVLLGEDGSVVKEDGKPFVQYVSGKIWVNNHAHVLIGKNGFSTEHVKVFLDQVDVMPFITGAVQPKLNQTNMNMIPMIIPDKKTLTRFNEMLSGFFGMILENKSQIKNLETVRDFLLPRLMSGKIKII